jgi:hypothetical protein
LREVCVDSQHELLSIQRSYLIWPLQRWKECISKMPYGFVENAATRTVELIDSGYASFVGDLIERDLWYGEHEIIERAQQVRHRAFEVIDDARRPGGVGAAVNAFITDEKLSAGLRPKLEKNGIDRPAFLLGCHDQSMTRCFPAKPRDKQPRFLWA